MKVLFFVHRFWPSVGGVEKYILELARSLTAMDHQVSVVAGSHVSDLPEHERVDGLSIHRIPTLRSPLRCRYWLWRQSDFFDAADVIQVSNTHMLEYLWKMFGQRLDRRKIFLTRHGMSCVFPVPESDKERARRSLDLVAGVVHDGEFIEKWLGVEPDICPNQGLSPEADELTPVPELAPDSAVYIGRVEADSGIRIYMDAVREVTRHHRRPFSLNVYGNGSLMPALREQVAREALPIRFHGMTPDAQDRIVDACFAFIDGRMAIQEAMARRRLVLAGYVDPLKRDYVCGEPFSPYLVAEGNGSALAERVIYYSDHPQERAALIDRAYQHARTLSWGRTAAAYLDLWHRRPHFSANGPYSGPRGRRAQEVSRIGAAGPRDLVDMPVSTGRTA
jgi:glycosyltransferase involved in cell wall biosynthesis